MKIGGVGAVQISPTGYLEGTKAVVWLRSNLSACEAPNESAAAPGVVDMDYDGDCAVKAYGARLGRPVIWQPCRAVNRFSLPNSACIAPDPLADIVSLSDDGRVLAMNVQYGNETIAIGISVPCVYDTQSANLTVLSCMPGSMVRCISPEGSVVAGMERTARGYLETVVWFLTNAGWIKTLVGGLGEPAWANGLSRNGHVMVGTMSGRAVFWLRNGNQYLQYDLARFYQRWIGAVELYNAHAVSPNGRYIVGSGWNSSTERVEAFLLDRGTPVSISK